MLNYLSYLNDHVWKYIVNGYTKLVLLLKLYNLINAYIVFIIEIYKKNNFIYNQKRYDDYSVHNNTHEIVLVYNLVGKFNNKRKMPLHKNFSTSYTVKQYT